MRVERSEQWAVPATLRHSGRLCTRNDLPDQYCMSFNVKNRTLLSLYLRFSLLLNFITFH